MRHRVFVKEEFEHYLETAANKRSRYSPINVFALFQSSFPTTNYRPTNQLLQLIVWKYGSHFIQAVHSTLNQGISKIKQKIIFNFQSQLDKVHNIINMFSKITKIHYVNDMSTSQKPILGIQESIIEVFNSSHMLSHYKPIFLFGYV